jgi:hypothetical protein
MTIKQQGGIFGRNPAFNDVEVNSLGIGTQAPTAVDLEINAPVPRFQLTDADNSAYTQFLFNTGSFAVDVDPTEAGNSSKFTIDVDNVRHFELNSSGNLTLETGNLVIGTSGKGILCGVTSTDRNAVVRADLSQGVVGSAVYISRSGGSTAKSQIEFANSNGVVGSITTSGSATAYNTSSDYRLKTDAQPMTGASDRVKLLSPVNFEWISDGTRVDGFLAHEVQEIVPEAVHGAKDAMREEEYEVTPAALDEDGNVITEAVLGTRQVPDYQAIDQSKLVPVLTAALQEALAKIEQLESRVASLEV